MIWPAIAILGFVTLQRLSEMRVAAVNSRRLLARGGHEVGAGHYPAAIALHAAWLAALWLQAPGRPVHLPFLILYLLLQALRVWTLRTLGPRWTTRIIVVPGETLVRKGPYRFLPHPNYLVVVGEIAVLPLVFGLTGYAVAFTLLNASLLWVRIRAEEEALTEAASQPLV
jgi:methyltransferase